MNSYPFVPRCIPSLIHLLSTPARSPLLLLAFVLLAVSGLDPGLAQPAHALQATPDNAISQEQADPAVPTDVVAAAACSGRCRVRIVKNTVVADNGSPLRGEHILAFRRNWGTSHQIIDQDFGENHEAWINAGETRNVAYYRRLRDRYHLNTIRLLVYRDIRKKYPENWYITEEVLPVIKSAVLITQQLNMYLIIDYHPVPPGRDNWSTQSPLRNDTYLPPHFSNFAEDSRAFWASVAPLYKNKTHVLYELHNEPNHWDARGPNRFDQDAVNYTEELNNYVRSLAPKTHFILWSFPGRTKASHPDTDMRDIVARGSSIRYNNASVGFHGYGSDDEAVLLLKNQYPSFMTEYTMLNANNSNANTIAKQFSKKINWYEQNRLSWVMLNLDWNLRLYGKTIAVTWPQDLAIAAISTSELALATEPVATELDTALLAIVPVELTNMDELATDESFAEDEVTGSGVLTVTLDLTADLTATMPISNAASNQAGFQLYLPVIAYR
jgi:hypothetical protein